MRVVVCDPGVGNVRSVVRAIEHGVLGAARACEIVVTREPSVVTGADFVVVPGQGSFGAFARAIEGGLADALREHIARGRPYLGICLGLQVLFETSEEAPGARGLAILRGAVKRLQPGIDPVTARTYALPHIGWNAVEPCDSAGAAEAGTRHYYFAHTYAAAPEDPAVTAGVTRYGAAHFTSMIAQGAVLGVQFHPEKSQREGLDLLARFFRS